MPGFEDVRAIIENILKFLFNDTPPSWATTIAEIFIYILSVMAIIWIFLHLASGIKNILMRDFVPIFYKREDRRISKRRAQFAEHIESQVLQLNNQERWSDHRFAELEAEVESQGRQRVSSPIPFMKRTRSSLRREPSLSRALQTSAERLILLEGDSGTGKSVTLRYVAASLAKKAAEHPRKNSIIPFYINLKGLRRKPEEIVDSSYIRSYIFQRLNLMNDITIEEFLEEEFDKGLTGGTWLFLFDSFDEIPEVLAATEADASIKMYAEAISSFMQGMNQCRGIIASRQFRGPEFLNWPRFRIKDLSEKRRSNLIRRSDLPPDIEKSIFRNLAATSAEVLAITRNPMFLGLLCDQVKSQGNFPENTHDILETYVTNRLSHDEMRISKRFNTTTQRVRDAAENFAFCMGIDGTLGLSPSRTELYDSLVRLTMKTDDDFNLLCDVLEYVKLARSETTDFSSPNSKSFTFAHRRFQEYFATCVVLRNPKTINPRQLLTDGRWRETTITLFQTQSAGDLVPILQEVRALLIENMNSVPDIINDPLEYIRIGKKDILTNNQYDSFNWPKDSLHVLDLVQQGFTRRLSDIPEDIRIATARLVLTAAKKGTPIDRKWALEVAGAAPSLVLIWLLQKAFLSSSRWLKEVAYRQVSKLAEMSDIIARSIRNTLANEALNGSLARKQIETEAFLARLPKSNDFLAIMRLLLWIPYITAVLNIVMIVIMTIYFTPQEYRLFTLVGLTLIFLLSILIRKRYPNSIFLQRMPLFITFLMVYILVAVLFVTSGILQASPLIILIYVCVLFWPAFGYIIAREGKFYQPIWWPFYPIIYAITLILRAPSRFINFFRTVKLQSLLMPAIFTASFAIIAYLLFRYYSPESIIFSRGFLGFIGISFLYAFYIIGKDFVHWFHDRMIWRTWYMNQNNPISLETFLESLNRYKRPSFYIRAVRFLREREILIHTEHESLQLKQLTTVIENAMLQASVRGSKRRFTAHTPNTTIGNVQFINNWLARYRGTDPNSILELGPEFLDEVCILTERIQLAINSKR